MGSGQTTGTSAVSQARSADEIIDEILHLFRTRGDAAYVGEPVSQTEHGLQAAMFAEREGADSALISAALLHDIGHLVHDLGEDCADHGIDSRHEELGARWLKSRFGPEVCEPIRLHVPAKRYLCSIDQAYFAGLSPASQQSLALQGGPFNEAETEQFRAGPHSESAVRLRHWDDRAKIPNLPTPDLDPSFPTFARRWRTRKAIEGSLDVILVLSAFLLNCTP